MPIDRRAPLAASDPTRARYSSVSDRFGSAHPATGASAPSGRKRRSARTRRSSRAESTSHAERGSGIGVMTAHHFVGDAAARITNSAPGSLRDQRQQRVDPQGKPDDAKDWRARFAHEDQARGPATPHTTSLSRAAGAGSISRPGFDSHHVQACFGAHVVCDETIRRRLVPRMLF